MVKKLGNFCLLVGLLGLVIFFSSSHFLVDQVWFLIGGIGFIFVGFSLRRRKKLKRRRIRKNKRKEREEVDESH